MVDMIVGERVGLCNRGSIPREHSLPARPLITTLRLWRGSLPCPDKSSSRGVQRGHLRVQRGEPRVVFRYISCLCECWMHSLDVVTVTSISFLSWQVFLQRRRMRWAQSPTRWAKSRLQIYKLSCESAQSRRCDCVEDISPRRYSSVGVLHFRLDSTLSCL